MRLIYVKPFISLYSGTAEGSVGVRWMTCINMSLWSTDETPFTLKSTYFTIFSKVPSGQLDRRSHQEQKDLAVRLQNLGFVIHLDLSYTCPATLSTTLFNFVYLGNVDDCMSGQRFLWKESDNIAISIECASGPVLRRLRLCELLPQRVRIGSNRNIQCTSVYCIIVHVYNV